MLEKQSISLKEEIISEFSGFHGGYSQEFEERADNILKLIQSHLRKEIDDKITIEVNPLTNDQREWYRGLGKEEAQRKMREDFIKIINNLTR